MTGNKDDLIPGTIKVLKRKIPVKIVDGKYLMATKVGESIVREYMPRECC